MKPEIEFLKETKTKFPKELHHVLDEIAHSRPAFCSIGKLCSYVVGSVDPLAGAEGLAFVKQIKMINIFFWRKFCEDGLTCIL